MKDEDFEATPAGEPPATAAEDQTDEQLWKEAVELQGFGTDNPGQTEEANLQRELNGASEPPDDLAHNLEPESSDDDPEVQPSDPGEADELAAQIDRLQHQIDSDQGRINAHTSRVAQKQAELARAQQRLDALKVDSDKAKSRRDKMSELSDEYEDQLGPIVEEVQATGQRIDRMVDDEARRVTDLQAEIDADVQAETEIFLKEHPDANQVMKDHRVAFDAWIEDQPKKWRDIAARNQSITNGAEASLLMARFKQALASAEDATGNDGDEGGETPRPERQRSDAARRESQKRGSRSTAPTTGKRTSTEPDPNSDDPKENFEWALTKLKVS